MNKLKKYWAIAKINFKQTGVYISALILYLMMIADIIVDFYLEESTGVLPSNMLYIIPVLVPIFIASTNYSKFMNLGIKKKTFFFGCIINYVVFALFISLLSTIEALAIPEIQAKFGGHITGISFGLGWNSSVINAFFSEFTFILFIEVLIHTLTFMQTKWYGWVTDFYILIVLCVFLPIKPLRLSVKFFFNWLLLANPAIVHIAICLIVTALIYASNLIYLRNRNSQ